MGGTCTAAFVAARNGHADLLRFLVGAAGADPDKGETSAGWTPCHAACINGHAGCVRVLLALGADPNRATKHGWAPCTYAAWTGRVAILRALSAGGPGGAFASVNAEDSEGKTALDFAEARNQNEMAAFLSDELGAKTGVQVKEVELKRLDDDGGAPAATEREAPAAALTRMRGAVAALRARVEALGVVPAVDADGFFESR
jgi:hypothetical protein